MRSERRSSKPGAELTDVFLGTRKAGKHGAQLALIRVFRVSRVSRASRVYRESRVFRAINPIRPVYPVNPVCLIHPGNFVCSGPYVSYARINGGKIA